MQVTERGREGRATRVTLDFVNADITALMRFLSSETNLTIIATEEVKGKITLVNLRNVTIPQALDKIKTALSELGYTTVQVDTTIVIRPLTKARQKNVPVYVGKDPKQIRQVDEVITQVMPLSFASASDLSNNLKPLVAESGNIFAHTDTNSLIITDVSSNIHRIALIVDMLDSSPIEVLKTQVFPLKYADAKSLAQTFSELFKQEQEMANLFQKLKGQPPERMMEALKSAQAAGAGIDAIRGQVKVAADERTNKLIVTASEKNLESIQKIIEALDTSELRQAEIKVFKLAYALATSVADELNQLLSGRSVRTRGGGRQPWEQPQPPAKEGESRVKGLVGEVSIVGDARLNAVLVSSDPQNFPLIESIIKELDQAEPQEEVKVFLLKYANAADIVTNLQTLFEGGAGAADRDLPWWVRERRLERQEERRMRGETGQGGYGIQGQVNMVADERLNAIIVSTASQNLPTIESLIKQLDVSMPEQEWGTKIFYLKYADAENVADILNNIYQGSGGQQDFFFFFLPRRTRNTGPSGSLAGNVMAEAYTTLNAVVVSTSTARNFDIIENFIKELDVPTPPDYKETTFIYQLEYSSAQQLEQLLNDVFAEESQQGFSFFRFVASGGRQEQKDVNTLRGQVRVSADAQTNSLIITTSEKNVEAVKEIIKALDVIRGQVWLDIKILEVSLDESTKLGLELSWQEKPHFGIDEVTGKVDAKLQLSQESTGFTYQVYNQQLNALLHTLMKENKVRTLSLPSILTRDNQAAKVSVGRDIPYLQSTTSSTLAPTQTFSFQFLQNVGVNITITPHIAKTKVKEGKKRTIGLDITQVNVGNLIEFTNFNAPLTSDSTFTTYVDVEDGQQIAVGGLIKQKKQEVENKVPILGSIPLVGRLFKKTETTTEDTEIIVLITPHIVDIQSDEDIATLEKLQKDTFGDTKEKVNNKVPKVR
jgi:general secretion pathway protein D